MTRTEFAKIMVYIDAATNKPLSPQSLEVYFDLLGDLPYEALMTGAKRILCERVWSNFPQVGELRAAAADTVQGQVSELTAAEAWEIAWKTIGGIDPEQDGSAARGFDGVPPIVVEAIKTFGLCAMCYGKEPVGVVRAQFVDIYRQLAARDRRRSLLPSKIVSEIENRRPAIIGVLAGIGRGIE